ncbi:unnamed protein product [Microthlaspi erraticum]|uniref:Uncharacterized protein n=1 Tax=Microthlaspi erraticum TaxID=1685480 RepID=A0A6D2K4U9_9BRAS|nr:unnamed protein product [Microthlaspi erraticum]
MRYLKGDKKSYADVGDQHINRRFVFQTQILVDAMTLGTALLAMCISLTEVPSNGKARKSQLIYTSTIEAEYVACDMSFKSLHKEKEENEYRKRECSNRLAHREKEEVGLGSS